MGKNVIFVHFTKKKKNAVCVISMTHPGEVHDDKKPWMPTFALPDSAITLIEFWTFAVVCLWLFLGAKSEMYLCLLELCSTEQS